MTSIDLQTAAKFMVLTSLGGYGPLSVRLEKDAVCKRSIVSTGLTTKLIISASEPGVLSTMRVVSCAFTHANPIPKPTSDAFSPLG
jgi:hypothetical protein